MIEVEFMVGSNDYLALFEKDPNYGADADGNRGQKRVSLVEVLDDNCRPIEGYDDQAWAAWEEKNELC